MTREEDTVLDPFVGSGSSLVAGILHNRKCAGAETESRYISIARNRILRAVNGDIKIREMNKPVYSPNYSNI
jgi:DNA modification methylase